MSITLKYATACAECGRHMPVGTEASYVRNDDGFYHVHLPGGCAEAKALSRPPVRRPSGASFDCYTCPACRCDWAFNAGAFERARDKGTPACPTCRAPWTELGAAINDATRLAA